MFKHGYRICTSLIALPLLFGCGQQDSSNLESEITALRQEVKQLQEEMNEIGSQVEKMETAAYEARKKELGILPDQSDFDDNGQLPVLGEANAQIAIVEFSDFECPYCKRFVDQTFSSIKENYIDSGKVKYLTRDLPLSFHPKAKGAAVAANCSYEQGVYWPMRSALYDNMKQLGTELYQKMAGDLSLDLARFNKCLEDPEMMSKIDRDIELASALGIRGTPSFLIGRIENGELVEPRLIVGAQQYNVFSSLFDELLTNEKEK